MENDNIKEEEMRQFALVKYFINVGNMPHHKAKEFINEAKSDLSIRSNLELDISVAECFIGTNEQTDIIIDMFHVEYGQWAKMPNAQ